jgi:protein SDA1
VQAANKALDSNEKSRAKRKLAALQANRQSLLCESREATFISENDIVGPRKKTKADYTERIASIASGREGREKFGSLKGKKKKTVPCSSTNREKTRKKPIMMVLGSGAVRGKGKASLREKQQKLRAHINPKKAHR